MGDNVPMRTRPALASLLAVTLAIVMLPGIAQAEQPDAVVEVALTPAPGERIEFDGRTYGGTVTVRVVDGRLVVVETVDLDGYLAGIREVPFSWPSAALEAQAVAARTYLAWTLARGRSGDGARYGFDICATTACQVYAGTGLADSPSGTPWLEAVEATAGEILVHDGTPAQTLYSSSSGPRTRSVEDIWGGTPKPYLEAVDSPEQGVTPYWEWVVELPVEAATRIFAAAGYRIGGDLRAVDVDATDDGGGVWRLRLESERGTVSIRNTDVRWIFNRHGPALYPGLLPARRADGRPWPQAILSYTFDAELVVPEGPVIPPALRRLLPADDSPEGTTLVVTGTGWGHGVGMSQWGAKAMADAGSSSDEIVGHYYGGLQPVDGGPFVPGSVEVGLAWGDLEEAIEPAGPFTLTVNGIGVGAYGAGEWLIRSLSGGMAVVPPADIAGPALDGRRWPR